MTGPNPLPDPVWYPYTPLADEAASPPLEISRAEGVYLFDQEGRSYLDGIASWWCCLLGHRHPRLMESLNRQSQKMVHVSLAGLTHDPARQLARRLVALTPQGLNKVFYTDNGSTAIEAAIKICLQYWQLKGQQCRKLLVGFEGGYHGDTLAAMAVGGSTLFHGKFAPWFPPHVTLPSPDTPEICLEALQKLLRERKEEVACLVIEPLLQAAGGMRVHSADTLREIARLCQEVGIPVIADEIATGLGRTGSLWAVSQAGVTPDLLCASKSLTGGMLPLAVTLIHEDIVAEFEQRDDAIDRTFYHGHTYTGHALACAVACEVLDLVKEPKFFAHIARLTAVVAEELAPFGDLPGVATDQLGPVGIVRTNRPGSRPLLPLYHRLLEDGFYLRPLGSLFYFWPPLVVTEDQLCQLIRAVCALLKEPMVQGSHP